MFDIKSSFKHASPRGSVCFMSLIFTCLDPVSYYFCFVLLPIGPMLWWVECYTLYILGLLVLCVACL